MKNWLVRFTYSIIFIGIIQGCTKKEAGKIMKDKDMTIQIGRLANQGIENGGLGFKARIIPASIGDPAKNKDLNINMLYKMDSTFYLQNKTNKIYPNMIQPIANGVRGSFEYMILFEPDSLHSSDNLVLVYQDKYLNHKKYTFIFYK